MWEWFSSFSSNPGHECPKLISSHGVLFLLPEKKIQWFYLVKFLLHQNKRTNLRFKQSLPFSIFSLLFNSGFIGTEISPVARNFQWLMSQTHNQDLFDLLLSLWVFFCDLSPFNELYQASLDCEGLRFVPYHFKAVSHVKMSYLLLRSLSVRPLFVTSIGLADFSFNLAET